MAKVVTLKGRKQTKRKSYTLRSGQKTLMTTPFEWLAHQVAQTHFHDLRSVSVRDNAAGKSIQLYVYGRPQR